MSNGSLELTILMPCLNEEETLETCIRKAQNFLKKENISGEVLISDNGSTDKSKDIALENGARVIEVEEKGYGSALSAGIKSSQGKFVIMGDADDSYNFSNLEPFVNSLRAGNELVMGNRFEGGIADGAMPFLHKYVGNPILSFLGRLFFNIPCKDFHCGLRGFERQKALSLNLHTTGMEFASEMVVKSALKGLKIDEVPTTLSPDGRTGAPHLNTWRDGWRHLCFLLLYTPKWLFFYPSLFLFMFGLVLTSGLFFDGVTIGNVEFSNNTFYAGCLSLLISIQAMTMGSIVRKYAHKKGFLPKHNYTFLDRVSLEHSALAALGIVLVGVLMVIWCFSQWASVDFGNLYSSTVSRVMVLALTFIACGVQTFFTAFVAGILNIPND